jgi:hypothetical protein
MKLRNVLTSSEFSQQGVKAASNRQGHSLKVILLTWKSVVSLTDKNSEHDGMFMFCLATCVLNGQQVHV